MVGCLYWENNATHDIHLIVSTYKRVCNKGCDDCAQSGDQKTGSYPSRPDFCWQELHGVHYDDDDHGRNTNLSSHR